jgi:hypothetical protein
MISTTAMMLDPALMFEAALGFPADNWQARCLRSQATRQLVLVGRQLGKTSCAAIKALHKAAFTPGVEVLLIATGEDQAKLIFDRMKQYFDKLRPIDAVNVMRTSVEFSNGSTVLALPNNPTTVRGHTPSLVILDEASRLDDQMLAAVAPMVAETNGTIAMFSTPAGRRGFYYSAFTDDAQRWERISARRVDYPHRMPPGFLEDQLATLGPALFRQEHENEFIEDGDQLISFAAIEAMSRPRPEIHVLYALEDL